MPTKNKLQVVYKNTDDLIPYARNAKIHDEANVNVIAGSIKAFGFNAPVLIDSENGIIAGHGRVLAAQKLGIKQVPCIELDGMTDAEKRAYILADNKIAEKSAWDNEMLGAEIEDLKDLGVDLTVSGFELKELDNIFDDEEKKKYTEKTEAPQYVPTGANVSLNDCFSTSKTDELLKEIEKSGLQEDEKKFLRYAAYRHLVFNYKNIAELYAKSGKEMQGLMEKSALVIIDFNDAIKDGFVKLSKKIKEICDDHE